MTLPGGARHLAGRVWNLIEPLIEHGLISILIAFIMFLVSRALETLASSERVADIHEVEGAGYSLVALLYILHMSGVLFIRIVKVIVKEAERPPLGEPTKEVVPRTHLRLVATKRRTKG